MKQRSRNVAAKSDEDRAREAEQARQEAEGVRQLRERVRTMSDEQIEAEGRAWLGL